jgi:hypothetical protein
MSVCVKAITNEHGYMLVDVRTNQTILYFNHTAVNENFHGKAAVTKEEAVKIADKLCGKAYKLVRVTENPYDYDILFERRINGIPVFGENCYVVVNRMTGKIAAFRKMPVEDVDVKPFVKIKKEAALKIAEAEDAKLYIVPKTGVVWITTSGTIVDAVSGKILDEKIGKLLRERYRTTVDFGKLGSKTRVDESRVKTAAKGIDNDQGAVFRAGDWWLEDNTDAAKSMEKGWEIEDQWIVNYILKRKEAVFYSGHGNKPNGCYQKGECILLKGTGKNPEIGYCKGNVGYGLQTRLFVIQACYAASDNPNSIANVLVERGVQCVIGDDDKVYDVPWASCSAWADVFWDMVTGNADAGYKRTAHEARSEANTWVPIFNCNLDVEKGDCNIYI